MICRICGSESVSAYRDVLHLGEIYGLVKCSDCSAIFISPLTETEGKNANLEHYSEVELEVIKREQSLLPQVLLDGYWNARIDLLQRVLDRHAPGKTSEALAILDIGCHVGNFLSYCPLQWKKAGIELSPVLAGEARSKGIDVFERPLAELDLGLSKFDIITLFNVIEHFDNPVQEMKEVHRALDDQGVVLVATPDVASVKSRLKILLQFKRDDGFGVYTHLPTVHQFFFDTYSLDRLMNLAGFSLLSSHNSDGRARWTGYVGLDLLIQHGFLWFQRTPVLKRTPLFDLMFRYYVKKAG